MLHGRGMQGRSSDEVYAALLYQCVGVVDPSQRIHLHCFTGTTVSVRQWLHEFPNTFFGFTAGAARFRPEQQAAVHYIPQDHLLLETDAPYFPTSGYVHSAPSFMKVIAESVAQIRGEATEDLLQASVENGIWLYRR